MRYTLSGGLAVTITVAMIVGFLAPEGALTLPAGLAKPVHFAAYLLLGLALAWSRDRRGFDWLAVLLCIALGVALELAQWLVPGRTFKLSDLGLNAAGALTGVGLAAFLGTVTGHRHVGGRSGTDAIPLARILKQQGSIPQQTQWLLAHRLAPVVALLGERGAVPGETLSAIAPFADRLGTVPDHQLAEEERVLTALTEATGHLLLLKGALLAWRYYPDPRERHRTDLDVLVDQEALDAVRQSLTRLGYRRSYEVAADAPLTQELWIRQEGLQRYLVDVHWDLRNHPALQGLFTFADLHATGQNVAVGRVSVPGLGPTHALLHGIMHWFDDLGQERPLVWLLDMDLIWRAMTEEERRATADIAVEKGLSGLVAQCLGECRVIFETPVDPQLLARLHDDGGSKRISTLIQARESKWRSYWHAACCEPTWASRIKRLRWLLLPPVDYLRAQHDEGDGGRSRFRLYLKRLVHGLRK
ncbi:VanZ family protein [Wenzhouxiangella sp. EGI_FJ10409]|uniref:VanZ family protein n=1 Tax=Wenzhouxiangella sp. EGI_FJ10409 TaxID=3243767 RepID=UPI0035DE9140